MTSSGAESGLKHPFAMRTTRLGFISVLLLHISLIQTPAQSLGLPTPADEILQLSRAGVSDSLIVSYIESNGRIYDLRPEQLVSLRNNGVSDQVLKAMLEQRKKVAAETPTTPAPADPAPVVAAPSPPANFHCPPGCLYCGGPLVFRQEPVSTLHVIPYPSGRSGFYFRSSFRGYYPFNVAISGPYRVYSTPAPLPPLFPPILPVYGFPLGCGHWHDCAFGCFR
jgi:hypothetical protein